MPHITINTEEVTQHGSQFETRASELEALLQAANTAANTLSSNWKGNRANRFQNDWQSMTPQLRNAIEVFRQAGVMLRQAANDFGAVDN
jgi:WXG100 family type VII secretion target